MKFIALDVNVGDSFIFMSDNNTFIVDGGKSESGILSKLNTANISDINVLICSHYDADHLNGIIGIAKSSIIHFNEIWLPDIFGDIALTISKNENIFHRIIKNDDIFSEIKNEISISNYIDIEKPCIDYKNITSNSYESFGIEHLEYICDRLQLHCCFRPFKSYLTLKIIKKIVKLIIVSIKSGAHIRWLKYVNKYHNNKIAHHYDLFALNSYETTIMQYNESQLLNALFCLTSINKESLVFLYNYNNLPNILFTSESDFKFMNNKPIQLNDFSIVTAPHHGSQENSNVYQLITGKDLIYVRCDKS